ncbi:uncharacterized protein Dwil_GK18983 [Drosophila willistoni]|uniref:Surfeit locus protein 4 homolog n=1 Tax=Drosophila willistoni TaxID=7260 RepID=B4NI75_DROWI|nr:uncharacterized protein Dwil_GK18983 [Drosophila willistoni]
MWSLSIAQLEDRVHEMSRRCRPILPHVARLCLIATYMEDALRMWFQWAEQRDFVQVHLECSQAFAVLIVFINLVGQLVGCGFILARVWVNFAVTLLAGLILLQVHVYAMPVQLKLILRNFSLFGGLLLIHAEAKDLDRIYNAGAGVPLLVNRRPQYLMQLTGRILLALMYLSLLQLHFGPLECILNAFGLTLMAFVVVGYRTRLAAFLLALILTIWNLYTNCWWLVEGYKMDYVKYNCFHTFSVVGGLLMVVVLGPGHVSLEQYKKRW